MTTQAERFLADLERKPEALASLADALSDGNPWAGLPDGVRRVLFLGMGSSRYAARVAALRLRARGVDAVAEYASADASFPAGPETLVVPISATGGSRETLDAAGRYAGNAPLVALVNTVDSPLASLADRIVPMLAGVEESGVACRTFQHTLVQLRALEAHLTGEPADLPGLCLRAADATADLLERRSSWLDQALTLLDGPHGVWTIAPAERISSAEQAALMVREGPRRAADACETGDWAHVDVYLTKTRDYRALLFPGSRYDAQAMEWVRERGSTVLSVGADVAGAAGSVRYRGDDDPDVRVLTEVLVAEVLAATWWLAQ
ncbi:SIS domain-containing protein [Cryptosporangium aurantiacum]|uniref:Fructoselysine-6-P-deglycase FrlB with duplicated sugar isomerase (SIS) domain n=1 Tax=Cryptosporangium aurantiacum TaxID=134849 RepID=A0A1M7H1G0_9ACTN|nr:SIS domain-containing protein [Cryptosporangium aurantiacum]SHM22401.1 Fructoselysine-6-P-deglycase FrlB with duplicated sugar isomerase (SIS) domain [Cryptosporangium aurantiacum]